MIIRGARFTQRTIQWIVASTLVAATAAANSEIVYQQLESGIAVNAEYLDSDSQGPPVLLLHGFLQTRDFFTVRRVGDALHEAGYRVLLPNLSLGINDRRQSLDCEAVHNHSIEQDTNEISKWVEWLYNRTDKPIIVIGHSAGSLNLVAFLDTFRSTPVAKSILISLVAFGQGPIAKENPEEKRRAETDLEKNGDEIHRYRLAYCDHYSTTAGFYLSYLAWDQQRTLQAISAIRPEPTIIFGGSDNRLGPDWKPQLQARNASIIEIDGANHFFDHTHEFDLLDSIEQSLGKL
ncbi:MAG: alpha/beta fold hydrolase [Candidatus Thiodiazotropha sp. (ex Ctena orbiculata)]|nr:alpha/beta fold hydrolase [Candidatus Thiodiazotropha taylori]PUB88971.1 MAG: alpha/beta hydrolase [gamma proteobacterium symbiont of Ctena orbiculata]MBT2997689.1 alpha/beta fold hydrolase [Candidatus Thiodiazotropha taylori]MBT3001890.1 alpha/beta fold hydrolase [Candidatus Thiodiazotropha taylori]MBV2107732.1 alpha/beta fold hydrolase [Candidatus Thiodiazotropha taylori]